MRSLELGEGSLETAPHLLDAGLDAERSPRSPESGIGAVLSSEGMRWPGNRHPLVRADRAHHGLKGRRGQQRPGIPSGVTATPR